MGATNSGAKTGAARIAGLGDKFQTGLVWMPGRGRNLTESTDGGRAPAAKSAKVQKAIASLTEAAAKPIERMGRKNLRALTESMRNIDIPEGRPKLMARAQKVADRINARNRVLKARVQQESTATRSASGTRPARATAPARKLNLTGRMNKRLQESTSFESKLGSVGLKTESTLGRELQACLNESVAAPGAKDRVELTAQVRRVFNTLDFLFEDASVAEAMATSYKGLQGSLAESDDAFDAKLIGAVTITERLVKELRKNKFPFAGK